MRGAAYLKAFTDADRYSDKLPWEQEHMQPRIRMTFWG